MRAPPEVLPPPAIVAARDWLISQPYWEPLQPLIDRLAKAPLWKQLNKRHPVMPHPQLATWSKIWARGGVLNGSDRDIATQIVFLQSVYIGNAEPETSTVANYKKIAESYRAQAARLRTEAKELEEARRRNRPYISFSPAETDGIRAQKALRLIGLRGQAEEYAQTIESAAEWCEAEADWIGVFIASDNPLLVERHRGPPHVRAYCILLAEITCPLYGDVLYGTVARIASVVRDCSVTPQQVIDWTHGVKAS
jgi:hypothetical protein